ncbi:MAG: hypothetical protein AB7T31_18870 [Gemmatimonadales bacterium]
MSRPQVRGAGQDVPSEGDVGRIFAGWMLLMIGGLVLVNTGLSSAAPGVTGADWSFALLAAMTSILTARTLWVGDRWAWWVAAAYGVVGTFFVLPITIALVFGSPREPIGTGLDALLFPSLTAVLLALLVSLSACRPPR